MIKKLDILLLRSFFGPLILTFFVSLFVFDMQFFFIYMDDLIGKGIGVGMVLQLLVYMSSTLVPMALPLAILLSAIMTFGNLGENYELVAIKSSGISLLRFMRPLAIFIVGISIAAFLFNNYVIPVANLKAFSLLYDMRRSKPTLSFRAGVFNNDLDAFSIKIGSKDKDGQGIRDIIIYDQTSGMGNTNVILAKKGVMRPTEGKRGLLFRLEDGWRYQEGNGDAYSGYNHDVQIRMQYERWDKLIDLSGLNMTRTNEELFKSGHQMMNVIQLDRAMDTIRKSRDYDLEQSEWYFRPYINAVANNPDGEEVRQFIKENLQATGAETKKDTTAPSKITADTANSGNDTLSQIDTMLAASNISLPTSYDSTFLQMVPDSLKVIVANTAASHARNIKQALDGTANSYSIYTANLLKHYVEMHKRFTLSFACLLMFLIGAPLGSIIRKGGIGMPIVVAIVFFLIYYILSSTGEKLALSGELHPVLGVWMATGMLLPIAVILIQQARNDSQLFSKEWYTKISSAVVKLWSRRKKKVLDTMH